MIDQGKINISIIGCTGSVGNSVMDICRIFPEHFNVVSLAARSNYRKIAELCQEFQPEKVLLTHPESSRQLKNLVSSQTRVLSGNDALIDLMDENNLDHIVFASSGTDAIEALKFSLEADLDVSLANKESIVAGGPWIMPLVKRSDQLRPLDSEHNAIWQCLFNEDKKKVRKVYLTASGGPFLKLPQEEFQNITVEQAFNHPVWKMGKKITIDSATLMNKGIELLEAMYLFNLCPEQLDAIIHPGSFVHGIVEFEDTTLKMSASTADMRLPAASCMGFPQRLTLPDGKFPSAEISGRKIEFLKPDLNKFPCLEIAMQAMKAKGPYPALILGADESAVNSFIEGKISFAEIPRIIETVLTAYDGPSPSDLSEAVEIIEWSRRKSLELC